MKIDPEKKIRASGKTRGCKFQIVWVSNPDGTHSILKYVGGKEQAAHTGILGSLNALNELRRIVDDALKYDGIRYAVTIYDPDDNVPAI